MCLTRQWCFFYGSPLLSDMELQPFVGWKSKTQERREEGKEFSEHAHVFDNPMIYLGWVNRAPRVTTGRLSVQDCVEYLWPIQKNTFIWTQPARWCWEATCAKVAYLGTVILIIWWWRFPGPPRGHLVSRVAPRLLLLSVPFFSYSLCQCQVPLHSSPAKWCQLNLWKSSCEPLELLPGKRFFMSIDIIIIAVTTKYCKHLTLHSHYNNDDQNQPWRGVHLSLTSGLPKRSPFTSLH